MHNEQHRYQVNWAGRQLAIIVAVSPEAAKASLIAERGYTYYTPEVLEAIEIPFPKVTDAFGNTR